MKHLSWRPSDIRRDVRRLPKIWQAILGIIVAITLMLVKSLTEDLDIRHNSWTYILMAVVYAVAITAAARFLARKFSS